jgi:hypothetical protein
MHDSLDFNSVTEGHVEYDVPTCREGTNAGSKLVAPLAHLWMRGKEQELFVKRLNLAARGSRVVLFDAQVQPNLRQVNSGLP